MNAVEFDQVWKRYFRGERFHSLRDQIPHLMKSWFRGGRNLGRAKNEFWAVQDVSFRLKKGESLGIIGPNGAGKSTVLKLLSKVTCPTRGRFKIQGRLTALIEVGAGFHPEFTGRENVYFNGAVLGMKQKEIDAKFDEIVEFSGVGEFIDTPVKRYSTGMSARLGFAVAAHVDPDVLLVDEVLSVGDMQFQAKCVDKMKQLFNSGVTIVFISHNSALVQTLCQSVILLDRGAILKQGAPEEVVPFYENLANERREEDVRRQIERSGSEEKAKDDVRARVLDVTLRDEQENQKHSFAPDEPVSIRIDYETTGRIERPIFAVEIFRSDNILCCHLSTQDAKEGIEWIEGRGAVLANIRQTTLGPGVYYTKVAIWDKDHVHPYVIAKRAVFKIESHGTRGYYNSIFGVEASWEQRLL